MSRDVLNSDQFDLMVISEHDLEHKRRLDRAGIKEPPEHHKPPEEKP